MDNNDSGRRSFADNLMSLINKHSMENGSDTPDYILCDYLIRCLSAFDIAVNARDRSPSAPLYLSIIAGKKEEELSGKSVEELEKMLNDL